MILFKDHMLRLTRFVPRSQHCCRHLISCQAENCHEPFGFSYFHDLETKRVYHTSGSRLPLCVCGEIKKAGGELLFRLLMQLAGSLEIHLSSRPCHRTFIKDHLPEGWRLPGHHLTFSHTSSQVEVRSEQRGPVRLYWIAGTNYEILKGVKRFSLHHKDNIILAIHQDK